MLEFVEITGYKRIPHLSLKLFRGTDKQVRHHLASQLAQLRSQHTKVEHALQISHKEHTDKIERLNIVEQEMKEVNRQQAETEGKIKQKLDDEVQRERQRASEDISEARNTLR